MLQFREVLYTKKQIEKNGSYILAGDIGGTNSNFGIFSHHDDVVELLVSVHFKSKEVKNFADLVNQILEHLKTTYGITIAHACFAAAGVVSVTRDYCKPTNLDLVLDAKEILHKTALQCCFIVNDFEVIGYGLRSIDPKSLVKVNEGKQRKRANKAILGAGTGLGKCILYWHKEIHHYTPVASEGGHADFAAHNQREFELVQFIKETENRTTPVSWEDLLSGNGIQRMYNFFKTKNGKVTSDSTIAQHGLPPDEIFNSRFADQHCWDTFELYTIIYARCAKNFALDALALGGIYIAGGIGAKNLPLFEQPSFMSEFTNCGKQKGILLQMPIYVITDYNVSLYGAAQYLLVENACTL